MEFLCHASATDHVAPLEDPHPQSRHAEVRQIEAKAIRKLKHPSRSRVLRSFLDN
jgi:RNA polymerase primary sigma factor